MAKKVIQNHHLSYDPEVCGKLYKGEHYIITLLNRRKNISQWFIQCLKIWIILNEHNAQGDLEEESNG